MFCFLVFLSIKPLYVKVNFYLNILSISIHCVEAQLFFCVWTPSLLLPYLSLLLFFVAFGATLTVPRLFSSML